jgi:hypothetical protein
MTAVRRVVPQVGIYVPARLPGGVWGAPPTGFTLKYTGNGQPVVTFGATSTFAKKGVNFPDDIVAAATIRAEQPWPQLWAMRVGVTASQEQQQMIQPPIETEFEVSMAVESSSFAWRFPVPWVGEASTLHPQSEQAVSVVAQSIAIRPRRIRPIPNNILLAGFETTLSFAFMLGLASPPQVVMT